MKNILNEAEELVMGEKAIDYGDVLPNFQKVARLWEIILGVKIPVEKVPLCMIALKLAREIGNQKRDNLVDIAGYALTSEMLNKEIHKKFEED